MIEVETVSQEAIQKALETLGLSKPAAPVKTAEQIEAEKQAELKKAEEAALQKEYEDTIAKAEELKNKLEGKTAAPAAVVAQATEAIDSEIVKGFESKVGALATLVQSKDQQIAELQKAVQGIADFNQQLGEKIGMISKQPLERKSVTTKTFLEKGGEVNNGGVNGQVKTFSLADKKQRNQLADIMYKAAISADGKGVKDEEFAKAIPCVELGSLGRTPQEAQSLSIRLLNEHKIVVTK